MAIRPSSKSKPSRPKPRSTKSASTSTKQRTPAKRPPPKQVKTKPAQASKSLNQPSRKKQRVFTDKELQLPRLNMITPVGVEKPRGKKKGKVFVDDTEGMMTILALVSEEKEGQIESKMIKARQLEEIREARRREMEKRKESKAQAFEEVKKEVKRKPSKKAEHQLAAKAHGDVVTKPSKVKKTVSFA